MLEEIERLPSVKGYLPMIIQLNSKALLLDEKLMVHFNSSLKTALQIDLQALKTRAHPLEIA